MSSTNKSIRSCVYIPSYSVNARIPPAIFSVGFLVFCKLSFSESFRKSTFVHNLTLFVLMKHDSDQLTKLILRFCARVFPQTESSS